MICLNHGDRFSDEHDRQNVSGERPVGGPRNVLIRRADGSQVIRPFRGLRKAGNSG